MGLFFLFYSSTGDSKTVLYNGQAVRGGSIVGEHEVIFAGLDEVIEIKHTAYSKGIFGKGAVEAAKFLAGKPAGKYGMEDVIGAGKL